MRTYLSPRAFRRGSPAIFAVQKRGNRHELLVFHERLFKGKPPYMGVGREYAALHAQTISREAYMALLKDAKTFARIFAQTAKKANVRP